MDSPRGPQTQSAMSTGSSSLVSSRPEKRSCGRRSSMSLDLSFPANHLLRTYSGQSVHLKLFLSFPPTRPSVSSCPKPHAKVATTYHSFRLHTLLFSPFTQDQGFLSQPTVRCYSMSSAPYFILSSSQSVTAHTKTSLFKPLLLLFSPLQTRHFGKRRRSTSSSLAPSHMVRLVITTILIVVFISKNHLSPIKAPTPDFPTLP
jgi:hypothetical protein